MKDGTSFEGLFKNGKAVQEDNYNRRYNRPSNSIINSQSNTSNSEYSFDNRNQHHQRRGADSSANDKFIINGLYCLS